MIVRAPGRVNLIGDHTDYNGLPVLPMAIQKEIRITFQPRGDRIMRLTSSNEYPPRQFDVAKRIKPADAGDWSNYARAAGQCLAGRHKELRGLNATVWGDIPEAAGLSSSSAMVVASALAILEVNRIPWQPAELAQMLARGERYVGTQGGGMDQTVCLCAEAGSALKISFTPFGFEPVPIPGDWAFLVGNSLVAADKSRGARERFNSTRTRCDAALRSFAKASGMSASYPRLMESCSDPELLSLAESFLPEEQPEFLRTFRHVVTEASRVERAAEAMRSGSLDEFGRAMVESHVSLREDLGVSCVALDQLVDAFLSAGAAGARVTGAGFGGCVVALCHREKAGEVLQTVDRAYYAERPERSGLPADLFQVEPVAGAGRVG
jgi:galactokinase